MKKYCILLLGAFGGLLSSCGEDPESPAAKHEWSVIESSLERNKSTVVGEMTLISEDGYRLAAFESNGHRIWIMLNPKSVPYYKQIPRGEYSVTPQQFQQIKDSGFATATVLECLSSHVTTK